jgi:predicted acyl esterase
MKTRMTSAEHTAKVLCVLLFALGAFVGSDRFGPARVQTQTDQRYDIVPMLNVMVGARDGVRLATDVYVPGQRGATPARFPTIVERTPYNKDGAADVLTKYFVPRGYVVVVQDVRGRYKSEGKWRPIRDDGPDGADLLKWIADQPWSNGKVGTVGTSYAGVPPSTPSPLPTPPASRPWCRSMR